MVTDIRKYFMKSHDKSKDNGNAASPKPPPAKRPSKVVVDDDDEDFVLPKSEKSVEVTPSKKLKSNAGRGVSKKSVDIEDDSDAKDIETPAKSGGRGRDGRGALGAQASGRGRGGGRGGFVNFGERKDPPHKGEKEVPQGASDCLAGSTFVISGTLDSLEREEAEDLIKRHGGRITGSVSKKTTYLLCDEDIGGKKSVKAKELGTKFLTEDGLFDMIRKSNRGKASSKEDFKKSVDKVAASLSIESPKKAQLKNGVGNSSATKVSSMPPKNAEQSSLHSSQMWTEKYKPKVPTEIIGNQFLVNQLRTWLAHWDEQFLHAGSKGKGKKQNDANSKKAVLLSGTPGIGKTTSAKVVCEMLGFQTVEVNASDTRGKADSQISKGISGSNANSIKELVSNETIGNGMDQSKRKKTVLIMDEVDGMSGGVADLIASIKISKIPIICICNDRHSKNLKSLVNYCSRLDFRKPTKQQMAKRLMHVAEAEGLQVSEIAIRELAERVNGDMRMALNQLQYMSLSMTVINYDDIKQRLQSSFKDEVVSPFTAVDKLLGFNGGKLSMDERIDLSISDGDLVSLMIQENYINYRPSSFSYYRPSSTGKDELELKHLNLIARAAESIGDGDIVNAQIRKYQQWQLTQSACLASCIIPAALLHGERIPFEEGEKNINRFGAWLGKNSSMRKSNRLLEDLHFHFLASREFSSGRGTLCLEYLPFLRKLPKDEAVKKVVDFMNVYSISQEDYGTIVELSKFQGKPNLLKDIAPNVKAALEKAKKEGSKTRMVRAADLIEIRGIKKAPKKRIAAMLEPVYEEEGVGELENDASDAEEDDEGTPNVEKLQEELQSLNSNGIKVEVKLKAAGNSRGKNAAAGRGQGRGRRDGSTASTAEKKAGRGSGAGGKRKR